MAQAEAGQVPAAFRKPADQLMRERHAARAAELAAILQEDQAQAAIDGLSPEAMREQLKQAIAARQPAAAGWRPACAMCVNNQKLAMAEFETLMKSRGVVVPSEDFQRLAGEAMAAGQMAQQQGLPLPKGTIPGVRQADTLVNGNALCVFCLTPAKQSSLAIGSAGMSMTGLMTGHR